MRRLYLPLSFLLILLVACSAQPRPEVASAPDATKAPLAPAPALEELPLETSPEGDISQEVLEVGQENFDSAFLGIHISDYQSEEQLSYFISSNAKWSRFDRFHWDLIEPLPQTPAIYDWSSVDEAGLMTASELGIESIGIIMFTPSYAQKYPGSVCGPIAEDQLQRFSEFLYALVNRYSQPPFSVKYWEIGNEPDVDYAFAKRFGFGCWGDPNAPNFGGGYYGNMLKFAYPMIKAADSQAQLLVGGLLLDCDPRVPIETYPGSGNPKNCTPALFLDGILENGGGDFFDGISYHAYDYYSFEEGKYSNYNWLSSSETNGSVLIPKAAYLRERLDAYGVTGKYILNTESGLICGRDGTDPGCQTAEFERTKAAYTIHANAVAFQQGLKANIWYSLMGWRASELLDSNYTPLPSYEAYRFNVSILANAVFKREVLDYPHFFVYEYETDYGDLWILWSRSGRLENLLLPALPVDIFDMTGEWITPSQEITTDYSPLYIRFISP
jgi:hypothetical protein